MPFTPFHFGPGMLAKGIFPNHFSLSAFALANVAMDIEPLLRMLAGSHTVHGASHTLLGAGLIGIATALAAPEFSAHAWQYYQRLHKQKDMPPRLTPLQAWFSALAGTFSHVLLDATMHRDLLPFLPFSEENPWLHPDWTQHVYLACLLAGALGLMLMLLRAVLQPSHSR